MVKDGPLKELKVGNLPVCESCLEGKMTKRSFSAKGFRAKEPLELVHSDVCRPLNVQARGGYEYFSLSLTTILGTSMFTLCKGNLKLLES